MFYIKCFFSNLRHTHNLMNARPILLMQNTGTDSESSIASFIQHD